MYFVLLMWLTWAICTCTLHLHCIFLEEQIWGYISLGFNPICHGEIYIMFMLIHCTVLFMSIKFYSILFYSILFYSILPATAPPLLWGYSHHCGTELLPAHGPSSPRCNSLLWFNVLLADDWGGLRTLFATSWTFSGSWVIKAHVFVSSGYQATAA